MARPWAVRRGLFHQYTAAIAACLSVVTSGSCAGWMTPLLDHLLGPDSEIPMTTGEMNWVVSILELGNFLSPLPAGYLATHVGRKPLILATGPLYIISWLAIICWPSALVLALARVLQGLTMGLTFTAAPVYLGEIASDSSRGAITSIFFTSWWVGYIISYLVGAILSFYPFTYFTLALNIPFILMFFWQTESPYYLIMADETDKAHESLKWLRDTSAAELKEELEMIKASEEAEEKTMSPLSALRDLVATPADRKALTLLVVISAVRISSGTGSLMTYIDQVFDRTPNLSVSPDVITVTYGVVMLIGGIVSTFTTDKVGRRPLLLASSLGCFCCTFLLGTYYFLLTNTSVYVSNVSWISPMLFLLYAVLCSTGLYPICVTYTSELFGSNNRGLASSVSSTTVTIFSFFCLVLFQPINSWLGLYANFFLYATTTLLGFFFFYFTAPETKGKSFIQIKNELHRTDGINPKANGSARDTDNLSEP